MTKLISSWHTKEKTENTKKFTVVTRKLTDSKMTKILKYFKENIK